jgi:two-component system sensor kinase FixL
VGDQRGLILVAIEDVTERRRVEKELRENEARKQGEEQVRERRAELAHVLRVTTAGELASGLAHELNQPLSAIANGVEACARYLRSGKSDPKKLLKLLNAASTEALRAGDIVEHLRGFIQKGTPQFERTDLREIAGSVPRLLGRELERERITLRIDLGPRPLPIHADRIQIEQVIVNLIQNAIDAVREVSDHRREIQLSTRAVNDGMAEAAVCDAGAGVSAAAAERLFDPFFTTKSHGLGMGLAISRSILEAHGGRIWRKRPVSGERGTTLCFTLPLRAQERTRKRRITRKGRTTRRGRTTRKRRST